MSSLPGALPLSIVQPRPPLVEVQGFHLCVLSIPVCQVIKVGCVYPCIPYKHTHSPCSLVICSLQIMKLHIAPSAVFVPPSNSVETLNDLNFCWSGYLFLLFSSSAVRRVQGAAGELCPSWGGSFADRETMETASRRQWRGPQGPWKTAPSSHSASSPSAASSSPTFGVTSQPHFFHQELPALLQMSRWPMNYFRAPSRAA